MSIPEPGQCVSESVWFKSSYSSEEGGECVEVADATDSVLVRDSKQSAGPVLAVRPSAWAEFIQHLERL